MPQVEKENRYTVVIIYGMMELVDLLCQHAQRKHLYVYFPGYSTIALHAVLHAVAQFHCRRNCPSIHSPGYFSALNTENTEAKKRMPSSSLSSPHLHA